MKQRELPSDPIEDSERPMEERLPMAKLLLERYGEFFPMGTEIGFAGDLQPNHYTFWEAGLKGSRHSCSSVG